MLHLPASVIPFFRFGFVRRSLEPDTWVLLKPGGKGTGFSKAALEQKLHEKIIGRLYFCVVWGLLRIPSSGKALSGPLWLSTSIFGCGIPADRSCSLSF